jgi:hypothetical protein
MIGLRYTHTVRAKYLEQTGINISPRRAIRLMRLHGCHIYDIIADTRVKIWPIYMMILAI